MAETPDVPETLTGVASTFERVAFHAAERPDAVALIDGRKAISYAQFSRDVGKFTMALRELGMRPGSTVAVDCGDLYTHWLLLLGFEQLNVATASFDWREGLDAYGELLSGVDLVLSEEYSDHASAIRQFHITEAWVRDTLARDFDGRTVREPRSSGDIVRTLRSSGTTGRPKRIAVNRRMYDLRAVRYGERYRFSQESRYLLTLRFSIGHQYGCATACLRSGGCVVAAPQTVVDIGIFAKYGVTHVSMQPHFLTALLDHLPAGFAKPADLIIGTSGYALSDQLGQRALSSLATEVLDFFGCNEVGGISFKRASLRDSFATVCPGVVVEVVDEGGQPLPRGEPGRLRIKSESMAEGYLDDADTTRRFFKDGWFYPSDIAILDGPRRLRVVGRADDMITVLGGKYAASDLEALVVARLGTGDVGVCAFADRDGIQKVRVAIAGVRLDHQELLAEVTQAFKGLAIGQFGVVLMTAIPRNAAGKIQRIQLKAAITAALGLVSRR